VSDTQAIRRGDILAGALGISSTQGTWIITSYAVAEAITVPLTGFVTKRFGAKRTLSVLLRHVRGHLGAVRLRQFDRYRNRRSAPSRS